MRKGYLYGVWIMLLLFLTGCSTGKKDYEWFPQVKGENEVLLYDRFDQRLATYDLEKHIVLCKNNEMNYFQYEFADNPFSNVYTAGHSIYSHFKIIEADHGKVSTLYSMEDAEDIFPLAYKNDNELFFIKYYLDDNGNEKGDKRIISHFDKDKKTLSEYKKTEGMQICNGAYLNGYLYYTVYQSEKEDYQLFKLNVQGMENDPEIVMEHLPCPELYIYDNDIWVSDKKNIYLKNMPFPKKSLNYIYKDYLMQLGPNSEADLELSILDLKHQKKEIQVSGVVGFELKKPELCIYTNTSIEKWELAY